jgi:hypothetical protein
LPVEDVTTFGVPFVLGVVGTLLVEWIFRPTFERKRRRQERWENELQELLELLELRLPRLAADLNLLLGSASWLAEVERELAELAGVERDDLTTEQREAVQRIFDQDREATQRAYEAWEEAAQSVAVLTRRVSRFHRPDTLTPYEVSGWLYSRLYTLEVSKFRAGKIPSGDYKEQEEKLRKRLQEWAEPQLWVGRPHRPRRPSIRPENLVTHVTRCPPRK